MFFRYTKINAHAVNSSSSSSQRSQSANGTKQVNFSSIRPLFVPTLQY